MNTNDWLILVTGTNVAAMWVSIFAARSARKNAKRAEKWARLAGATLTMSINSAYGKRNP